MTYLIQQEQKTLQKEKLDKIYVKKNHLWMNEVFLLFLSPFDASLVVSLQEWFAPAFCPSPIKSYVSFSIYFFKDVSFWSDFKKWIRPLLVTEKDNRAGVETQVSFRDMDRLSRKRWFKQKWFNGE
jgi:hypothetical protein